MVVALSEVLGCGVQASDKQAGKVADVYFDDETWVVRHIAVADAGGVGIQMASVDPAALGEIDTGAHTLHVNLTQQEIAGGPDVSLDLPVAHQVSAQNDPRLRSVNEVTGYRLMASDGTVGTINDFIVGGAGDWKVHLVVVDTGKGKVLVGPGLVDRIDHDAKTAHVELDQAKFARSPAYDPAIPITNIDDVKLVGQTGV